MRSSWELCGKCGGKIWTTIDDEGTSHISGWCQCTKKYKIDKKALQDAVNKVLEDMNGSENE